CRRRSSQRPFTLPLVPARVRSPAPIAISWRRRFSNAVGCTAASSVIIAAPVANIWESTDVRSFS
ncbi:CG34446, partial [Drosophila busckii]